MSAQRIWICEKKPAAVIARETDFTCRLLISLVLLSFGTVSHASGMGNIFGSLMGRSGALESETGIDNVLVKAASQINKKLPMDLDENTRLDSVSAVPGRQFIYHYTLVTLNSTDVSADTFDSVVKPQLKNRLCESADMQNFLKNGVTISYLYKGKDGHPIGGARFAPSECSQHQN
jgi:hypothetical protein